MPSIGEVPPQTATPSQSDTRQDPSREACRIHAAPVSTLRDAGQPHTLRHTAAMALLHAGVDTSTIALWLGHASTKATDVYLHADLALKEKAWPGQRPTARTRNATARPTRS
jgi:site-specific recombinase XerD